MKDNYDKVFDLFLDTSILSLRRYETKGINIYEFNKNDLDHILSKKIIDNIPSIYILEDTKENEFYIGETEDFTNRIKNHLQNKKFNKIYVVNAEFLNKNICLEIEMRTIESFKNSIKNYKVKNKTENNNSYLNYADKLKFKDFWKTFQEIYFLLQFNLNPKNNNSDDENDNNEIFYFKNGKMKIVKGGYLLLEGSQVYSDESEKYEKLFKKMAATRKEWFKDNKIDENNIMKENLFSSYPSPLAFMISGKSANGYDVWKTKNKKTLNEYLGRKNNN